MKDANVDILLPIEQAAQLLGLSRAAVYAAIDRGSLPFVRTESGYRVTQREALAYATRAARKPAPPRRGAVVGGSIQNGDGERGRG